MSNQSGIGLVELVTVVAIGSLLTAVAVVYSVPWLARESCRGTTQQVRAVMQLARTEAVSRNAECRAVIDTAARRIEVWDSRGTATTSDDLMIHDGRLPESVTFSRPDTGSALTIQQIGASTSYETIYDSAGVVSAGVGDVFVYGGESYGRVSVYGAGGLEVRYWDGSAWQGEY